MGAQERREIVWIFLCLLFVEFCAFGINSGKVGIYQDEWISFGQLHFVPHSLPDLIAAFNADPRKIVRPLECLNIPVLFYFVGEKPFWYHVAAYGTEFFSAFFLFLFLDKLSSDRALSFCASLLFLLYPTHDSTHYAIVMWDLAISTAFFTLSLWLYLKSIELNSPAVLSGAGISYVISIFNHEDFLPLAILYPILYLLHTKAKLKTAADARRLFAYQMPFMLVAASMILYRVWFLPAAGLGWQYSQCFSLNNFLAVMSAGIRVNISPQTLLFCAGMTAESFKDLPYVDLFYLGGVVTLVFIILYREIPSSCGKAAPALKIIQPGAAVLLLSYTIFAFSSEHMPTIDTWHNRVNMGGSLGASLIVAGLLWLTFDLYRAFKLPFVRIVAAGTIALLAGFFLLADRQLAKPWITSWHAQKELMYFLRQHALEVKDGDSIIIGGITRYTSKATPVVDGVWDWQNIVRTTLNNKSLHATVFTSRLSMEPEALLDRLDTLILGRFPYKQMILYSPQKQMWIRISTRKEFSEQTRKLGWASENDIQ